MLSFIHRKELTVSSFFSQQVPLPFFKTSSLMTFAFASTVQLFVRKRFRASINSKIMSWEQLRTTTNMKPSSQFHLTKSKTKTTAPTTTTNMTKYSALIAKKHHQHRSQNVVVGTTSECLENHLLPYYANSRTRKFMNES